MRGPALTAVATATTAAQMSGCRKTSFCAERSTASSRACSAGGQVVDPAVAAGAAGGDAAGDAQVTAAATTRSSPPLEHRRSPETPPTPRSTFSTRALPARERPGHRQRVPAPLPVTMWLRERLRLTVCCAGPSVVRRRFCDTRPARCCSATIRARATATSASQRVPPRREPAGHPLWPRSGQRACRPWRRRTSVAWVLLDRAGDVLYSSMILRTVPRLSTPTAARATGSRQRLPAGRSCSRPVRGDRRSGRSGTASPP